MTGAWGFPELPAMDGHGTTGDLWYQGSTGQWEALPVPGDYATTHYVLHVSQTTGKPEWRAVTDLTFGSDGFGTAFGYMGST